MKVGAENKKISIDIPPNYNPIRFNDAGTVRGCRLVRPGMFNATPIHTMVDGRVMALAGSAVVDIDTYVDSLTPNYNYSNAVGLSVGCAGSVSRIYVKCLPNKILHLFCSSTISPNGELTINEVNPADFNIKTITWNNQPALGSVIFTYTSAVANVWDEIPTGTIGGICIKYTSEILRIVYLNFRSSQYSDVTKRPYFTDP